MTEYEQRTISPSAAFFLLFGLMGAGLIVGYMAGLGAWIAITGKSSFTEADMLNPQYANGARVMQAVSVFFMFFLPAFIIARLMSRRPFQWLGYREGFNGKQLLTVILILAACIPLVGALGALNQAIPLSHGLETIVKKMEDSYTRQAEALATMRSTSEFIFSLFVMALLPAVFEETFFRGGVQQLLAAWFRQPIAAIVVTSIIFSALHISWYGFLPRLALGFVLGLIFYESRSIWLNMLLHFLNNALAVGAMYYSSLHHQPVKDAFDDNSPIWIALPALIALVLLFRFFRQLSFKRSIHKIPPMDGPSFTSTLV